MSDSRVPRAARLFTIVGLVLAVASMGYATPVTVHVTGHVTGSDFSAIAVNTPVTGSYTYDDAAPPTSLVTGPFSSHATYSLTSFTLQFADGSTMISSAGDLSLWRYGVGTDLYDVYADTPGSLTGSFTGLSGVYAEIAREDPTGAALGGYPAIPDPAGVLLHFPVDSSRLVSSATEQGVVFELTSLSARPPAVPVPGAAALALIGSAGIAWLRRRRTL